MGHSTNLKFLNSNISELDVLYYEVLMLNKTANFYPEEKNYIKKNSLLESFLIHARNLIDFLEDNRKNHDDSTCSNFINIEQAKINPVIIKISPRLKKKINKNLSHMTTTRISEKIDWADEILSVKSEINNRLKIFLSCLSSKYFPTKRGMHIQSFLDLINE